MGGDALSRTTRLFVASVRHAMPDAEIQVQRSSTSWGRSNYVHIRSTDPHRYWKVRISDHPVDMRRATSGREDLYLRAGARPDSWAVWVSERAATTQVGDPHDAMKAWEEVARILE